MIDLRSDTATKPTEPMRQAIAAAEVGDEQLGEDPSVNDLCERVADLLGHEAAIFLPSGIMCNQVALAVHCRPGDEVLAADNAHILQSEGGAVAANVGAIVSPVVSERGIFTAEHLSQTIRPRKLRAPRPRVVSVEQTTNRGGGAIWPQSRLQEVAEVARSRGLAVHMDGARIMNAVVAAGIAASDFAAETDSCWIDLTKGLGCPVGAVLAGDRDFIDEAWFYKNRLGGAMRQAGIVAAAGSYALSHHVDRLEEDHRHATLLAEHLESLPGVSLGSGRSETNIVIFDLDLATFEREPGDFVQALEARGVRLRSEGGGRFRAITHLGVSRSQIEKAAAVIEETLVSWNRS